MYRFDEHKHTISRPFPLKIKKISIEEKSLIDTSNSNKESDIYWSFWRKSISSINIVSDTNTLKGFYITNILNEPIKDSVYSINNIIKPNHTYTFDLFNKAKSNGFRDNLYLIIETDKNNKVAKWEVVDIYYKKKLHQYRKINGKIIKQSESLSDFIRVEKQRKGKTIIRYKKSRVPKKRD